jgi:hypothetical protein
LHGWASETDCTAAWQKTDKAEASHPAYLSSSLARTEHLGYLMSQQPENVALIQRLRTAAEKTCGDTHIWEFGRFYARLVELVCPLAGFALFLILARPRPSRRLWIPLAILAATLLAPHWHSWEEIMRASFVEVAMIGSLALLPNAKRREDAI